ncbi:hypothetical protein GUJ93_ZPchr0003g18196 [Zizania palustris]|uniref:Ribosomal protein L7/L12 oligomerisation domain-containing protein n=1 Tax=Zizania palustris TaxID=103762 RepID=A0A8J5RY15_ZIZPA|nr:hypothetical protein GUJ93_ZPchr0003g18196 [Zizania palustris]
MASRLLVPAARPSGGCSFSTVTPTPRVSALVDKICGLTLIDASSLTEALRGRLGVDQLPPLAILTGGAAPLAGGGPYPGAAGEEAKAKEENMAFDVKLEGFDAAAKLKIIKELRPEGVHEFGPQRGEGARGEGACRTEGGSSKGGGRKHRREDASYRRQDCSRIEGTRVPYDFVS